VSSIAAKVLVYRLGSLGDTVVALPCFHLIRRRFPSAEITLLTNVPVASKAAPVASVLENTGLFDRVLEYPLQLRDLGTIRQLRSQIRSQKFQAVIHLAAPRGRLNSIRDYVFFRACGIKHIIGVPFKRRDLEVSRVSSGLYESESVRLARRLSSLGVIDLADESFWNLRLSASENSQAAGWLEKFHISAPFLAVGIGTKMAEKDWGSANWTQLLVRLTDRCSDFPLVALGSGDEREVTEECIRAWKAPAANLCGVCSPRVSAAILQRAILFLGHDSGPMHLAAAVKTPCVALFSGRSPPGQWFPRGDGHAVLWPKGLCGACVGPCKKVNGQCILTITVDEVVAAVRRVRAGSGDNRTTDYGTTDL
jgi:ADP-heptose:LPS heptosyltransferase